MEALVSKLNDLQSRIAQTETDIETSNQSLGTAQQTLNNFRSTHDALASQITPLQRLVAELDANHSTLETERQAVECEAKKARCASEQLQTEIRKALRAPRRAALEKAIAAVEASIDEQVRNTESLRSQASKAEATATEAQQCAEANEAAFSASLSEYRQLPGQIQVAFGRVTGLAAAAQKAVSANRWEEAYFLARELNRALAELTRLADPAVEMSLRDRIDQQWQDAYAAREATHEPIQRLEQLRQELAQAEAELQRRMRQREADIRTAITALNTAE